MNLFTLIYYHLQQVFEVVSWVQHLTDFYLSAVLNSFFGGGKMFYYGLRIKNIQSNGIHKMFVVDVLSARIQERNNLCSKVFSFSYKGTEVFH